MSSIIIILCFFLFSANKSNDKTNEINALRGKHYDYRTNGRKQQSLKPGTAEMTLLLLISEVYERARHAHSTLPLFFPFFLLVFEVK